MSLVHDVVKKICFHIEDIFWIEVSSSNGLSVVRRTTSIFHVEVACATCVSRARSAYTMFLKVQGSNPRL